MIPPNTVPVGVYGTYVTGAQKGQDGQKYSAQPSGEFMSFLVP